MSNAWNAKLVSCFETAVEKVEKLQSSKLNKARLKFIYRVICALCSSRNVSFTELADKMDSPSAVSSSLRQIQRFMSD